MKKVALKFRQIDKDKFEAILSGQKTIETRAATDKYKDIYTGDTLVFICGVDKIEKEVHKAEHFSSIETLLESYDLEKILPGIKTIEEAKEVYYSFPGYKEKIEEYGIMAFVLDS